MHNKSDNYYRVTKLYVYILENNLLMSGYNCLKISFFNFFTLIHDIFFWKLVSQINQYMFTPTFPISKTNFPRVVEYARSTKQIQSARGKLK